MEIPLVTGLLLDSVVSSTRGDQDHFDTITDVNPNTVTMTLQAEQAPSSPDGHPTSLTDPPPVGKGTIVIDTASLAASNRYADLADSRNTRHYAGSTDRQVSTETLNQLRAGKVVPWQEQASGATFLLAAQRLMAAHKTDLALPTKKDWGDDEVYDCNLQRVEPTDLAFPVIVNDEPVELPVLHARCVLDDGLQEHFYILDQPSNPLFLYHWTGLSEESNQVTRITFDPSKQPSVAVKGNITPGKGAGIESKLAEKQPVEIYGIYFAFNSAFIKPESEVVLKQISDIMHKNPAWKLSVSGHTDNIGGDDFNQKLSQARAAAVKDALVKQYKIDPDRLTTGGYGASQPIADNAKVEGRARNRRVVLQRQ
jgi:outer membrane protein OmpA-like peptidoglycan-associated protein